MVNNSWHGFRAFGETMRQHERERARWHRRQRIKRLKGRIVFLGAFDVLLNTVINNAVARYFEKAA